MRMYIFRWNIYCAREYRINPKSFHSFPTVSYFPVSHPFVIWISHEWMANSPSIFRKEPRSRTGHPRAARVRLVSWPPRLIRSINVSNIAARWPRMTVSVIRHFYPFCPHSPSPLPLLPPPSFLPLPSLVTFADLIPVYFRTRIGHGNGWGCAVTRWHVDAPKKLRKLMSIAVGWREGSDGRSAERGDVRGKWSEEGERAESSEGWHGPLRDRGDESGERGTRVESSGERGKWGHGVSRWDCMWLMRQW